MQLLARVPGVEGVLESDSVRFTLRCPEQGEAFTGQLDTHWLEWLLAFVAVLMAGGWVWLRARSGAEAAEDADL